MGIELPAELASVAAAAGVRWPQADEEAMRATAQAWRHAGTQTSALAVDADKTAGRALSVVQGAAGTAATQHWHTFVAPDTGHLSRAAQGCQDAADRLDHAADQVGAAKVQIVQHLVTLAQHTDAANQAAASGHPVALAGLPVAVQGTAVNVAQVNHTLTNSIALPAHGPLANGGPLGQPVAHGLLSEGGPVGQIAPPLAQHGDGALDHIAPPGDAPIPATPPSAIQPVGAGHPTPPTPGGPGAPGGPGGLSAPGGPGAPLTPNPPGAPLTPSVPGAPITPGGPGVTVAQSAAPPVAPPPVAAAPPVVTPAQPAAITPTQNGIWAAPTAGPPPIAEPMPPAGPMPATASPGPTAGPAPTASPAPAASPTPAPAPPSPPATGNPTRGTNNPTPAIGTATATPVPPPRPGARSAVAPPAVPPPPVQTTATTTARQDDLALFLLYLFPDGHQPTEANRPVSRQLPPPPPDTDFAAGLRFPPHDHPESGLITPEPTTPTPPTEPEPTPQSLTDGYDPLGYENQNEHDWDRRFVVRHGAPAEYAWPPAELFPEGGCTDGEPIVLEPDTVIDRFGTGEGRVFAEAGTPYKCRALPPDHLDAGYRRYRVAKELPAWRTLSAPWFGQPGGGVRLRTVYAAADLVAFGYLVEESHGQ